MGSADIIGGDFADSTRYVTALEEVATGGW